MAMFKYLIQLPAPAQPPDPVPCSSTKDDELYSNPPRSPLPDVDGSPPHKKQRQDTATTTPSEPQTLDVHHYANIKVRSALQDNQRYDLLTRHFSPNFNYKFPPRLEYNKQRRFQYTWLPMVSVQL